METTATARRPRRLPRIALALGAVVLSLVMVFNPKTTPPANALIGAAPIAVGAAGLSSGPASSAVVGGLCATGAGCLALAAIGLGITAYATRDTWMPWVSDAFNRDSSSIRNDGSTGCPITLGAVSISPSGGATADVGVAYTADSSCGQYNPGTGQNMYNLALAVGNVLCIKGPGTDKPGDLQAASQSFTGTSRTTLSATAFATVTCPAGLAPFSAVARILASGGQQGSSKNVEINFTVPDAFWSTKVDVKCKRPDGTTFTRTDTEVGQPDRLAVPSCRATDPTSIPTEIKATNPAGTSLINSVFPDWQTEYPNCFGPSGLQCSIKVWVGTVPCNVGVAGCEFWYQRKDDPASNLSCRFGSYTVPMPNCEPLRRAYQDDKVDVITEPSWPTAPQPNPEVTTPPNPNPSETAPANPDPTTPTDPLDPEVENPMPPIPQDPENPDTTGESCMGDAWSFNPVKWVYVPVKCALIWAFKPKVSLQLRLERIQGSITTKVPFSWISGFVGVPGAIPSTGCPNWVVHVGSYSKNVVCGSSFTDAVRAARPVLLVFMGSLALWPLIRSTAYAAFPIIKPQPGVLR